MWALWPERLTKKQNKKRKYLQRCECSLFSANVLHFKKQRASRTQKAKRLKTWPFALHLPRGIEKKNKKETDFYPNDDVKWWTTLHVIRWVFKRVNQVLSPPGTSIENNNNNNKIRKGERRMNQTLSPLSTLHTKFSNV